MDRWAGRNHAGTALFLALTLVDVAWLHSQLVAVAAIALGVVSIPIQQLRQPMGWGVFAFDATLMLAGVAVNALYLLR